MLADSTSQPQYETHSPITGPYCKLVSLSVVLRDRELRTTDLQNLTLDTLPAIRLLLLGWTYEFDEHVITVTGTRLQERNAGNVRLLPVKMAECLTRQAVDVTVHRVLANQTVAVCIIQNKYVHINNTYNNTNSNKRHYLCVIASTL